MSIPQIEYWDYYQISLNPQARMIRHHNHKLMLRLFSSLITCCRSRRILIQVPLMIKEDWQRNQVNQQKHFWKQNVKNKWKTNNKNLKSNSRVHYLQLYWRLKRKSLSKKSKTFLIIAVTNMNQVPLRRPFYELNKKRFSRNNPKEVKRA